MNKYFDVLRKCPLFIGIYDEDLSCLLGCLGAQESTYKKGDTIMSEGTPAKYLGIVLNGKVQIERVDYYGNRRILTSIGASQIFGESFVCAGLDKMPVDVVAVEDASILLINAHRITQSCSNACSFHSRLIFNLLNIVAKKNLIFHEKIDISSKRSTREKLMTYLLLEAKKHGSDTFTIPYDRQELADYLNVERSGLSAEISKLRKERMIECRKCTFTLFKEAEPRL